MQQEPHHSGLEQAGTVGRMMVGIFTLCFAGVGITVLIFLWSQPFGRFGSPPLFFRIFGSFIAIAFITIGGGMAYLAFFGPKNKQIYEKLSRAARQSGRTEVTDYGCPSCGAALDKDADVSPHGDVKCGYCDTWFNVHGK